MEVDWDPVGRGSTADPLTICVQIYASTDLELATASGVPLFCLYPLQTHSSGWECKLCLLTMCTSNVSAHLLFGVGQAPRFRDEVIAWPDYTVNTVN